MKLLGKRLLIEVMKTTTISESGLALSNSDKDKQFLIGKILAIGNQVEQADIKVGNICWFHKHAGVEFSLGAKNKERNILLVMENDIVTVGNSKEEIEIWV